MDSQQILNFGSASAEVSYERASPRITACCQRSYGSFGLALGKSTNSSLSSQFDGDTSSVPSNHQEQLSSTDANSEVSPSGCSPLEAKNSFCYDLPVLANNLVEQSPLYVSSSSQIQLMSESSRYANRRSKISPHERVRDIKEAQSYDLKKLLVMCAQSLFENNADEFKLLVGETRALVSISGEPIQRLGAYLLESLVARHEDSGANIYRALRCQQPESKELLSYMRILYDICPYLKFGYEAANGAIAEAFKDEDRIHIIDFQIAQGTQWITLIQALAARPGGPPLVRITGIDDPVSEYARGDGLQLVGEMLHNMSKKFKIPLEFNALPANGPQVKREMLDIRPGESLAVNFTLQLYHIPDESVDVNNPRDELLRMVKSLSPKILTLVEQESNTNTTPFITRFMETLDYYSALFESIDVTMARDSNERISVEQHCLAKDIVNIIACEGKERVERHELLGKWQSRLTMAGFKPYPLSSYVNSVLKSLLGYYSDKYTVVEKDGALLLGWKNRNLISASAWQVM